MKTKIDGKDRLYIGLFIILSVVSGFALTFSLADINCEFLAFSATGFREIISVFVSAVALVLAAYFAIMAISAYGRIEKIQKTHDEVDDIYKKCSEKLDKISQKEEAINNELEQAEKHSKELAESFYTLLDEQIKLAEEANNIVWKNELMVRRARMSHKYPILDPDLRIKLLFELAYVGNKSDVDPLEKIINNERGDIKDAAKLALEELKKILDRNSIGGNANNTDTD